MIFAVGEMNQKMIYFKTTPICWSKAECSLWRAVQTQWKYSIWKSLESWSHYWKDPNNWGCCIRMENDLFHFKNAQCANHHDSPHITQCHHLQNIFIIEMSCCNNFKKFFFLKILYYDQKLTSCIAIFFKVWFHNFIFFKKFSSTTL